MKSPCRLLYLNAGPSLVELFGGGLGGTALMEEMSLGLALGFPKIHTISSALFACCLPFKM